MASIPKKLTPSKFVSEVVKDPKTPVETLLLHGYAGDSSEAGHTRLYFDPQLSSYVEIPDDAILHSQEIPAAQSPLGGTYVWIKRDTQVIHGQPTPARQKGAFLEGPIMGGVNTQNVCNVTTPGPCVTVVCTIPPQCHNTIPPQCPLPPTPACPHTPLHGCPPLTPACPPTPNHPCIVPTSPVICHVTPACPPTPHQPCIVPTSPVICQVYTVPPHCPINTASPICIPQSINCHTGDQCFQTPPPTIPLQACQPQTLPAVCTHTIPPQCIVQTSPVICQVHTLPPQCPNTSPAVCQLHTVPPQCIVQTSPVLCRLHTLPPQCPNTSVVVCQVHTLPPQCPINTANPICVPQSAICPSVACPSLACASLACGPGGFPGGVHQ
jgi:hypothetical protein